MKQGKSQKEKVKREKEKRIQSFDSAQDEGPSTEFMLSEVERAQDEGIQETFSLLAH